MKLLGILAFIVAFGAVVRCETKLTGTLYDSNGAVIASGQVEALGDKKKTYTGKTDENGRFEIGLPAGLYALKVTAPGFLTILYQEYLVVDAEKMTMDFVMFGGRYHEPCGVSGADCLPERLLRKDYKITYSPSLKQLIQDFTDTKQDKK